MKRNAIRSFLNHPRFWIPGSAARPRNDTEGINTVEQVKNNLRKMLLRCFIFMIYHERHILSGAYQVSEVLSDPERAFKLGCIADDFQSIFKYLTP